MADTKKPAGLFGVSWLRPADYYGKCMFGGVLACGITHASVVTIDVAKCRSQAWGKTCVIAEHKDCPMKAEGCKPRWPSSFGGSVSAVLKEGAGAFRIGWVPTFFGYGAQGLFKFGLNEFFKDFYQNLLGIPDIHAVSTVKRLALWAVASGSAEIFADIALCPFEMTKVKMQVPLKGDPAPPRSMLAAFNWMKSNNTGYPFGSLKPLWLRQVPYTMIKFVGFYQTQEMVYQQLFKSTGKKKTDYSEGTQLGITFLCGYWAGIFCAIATQPFDNLVSMKANPANASKSFGQMANEFGVKNLFTKGLGMRIFMIGTLTGLQWWIYGSWKSVCGLGTS